MDSRDAARLIAPAVRRGAGGVWADLGAGMGTFTEALADLLGANGQVYAVEEDPMRAAALDVVAARTGRERAAITVVRGDFAKPLKLPWLDGVLLANALHYVTDDEQAPLLGRLARGLAPAGTLVVVEYDDRPRSRWVPYPVSLSRLNALAQLARLTPPEPIGRRGSLFGGTMYAARIKVP